MIIGRSSLFAQPLRHLQHDMLAYHDGVFVSSTTSPQPCISLRFVTPPMVSVFAAGRVFVSLYLFIQVMKASKSQLQRLMQIKVPLSTSTTYFAKPRLSSKVPVLSGPNIAFYTRNNSTRSLKIDIPGPPLLSSYILLPTAQASSCFTTKYVSYKYAQMKRAIG